MDKISFEKLYTPELCDSVMEKGEVNGDITFIFSGAAFESVTFTEAHVREIRIAGYEVLDEDEEVVFDMPNIEILGEQIPDVLLPLLESKPHVVGFSRAEGAVVLTLSDTTDTYEIEIEFEDVTVK
ncbi:MAG: hypothetical protein IJO93_07155 [Clostridia bacterium]|nr:hypothetical protein [Clostridia bacterium]